MAKEKEKECDCDCDCGKKWFTRGKDGNGASGGGAVYGFGLFGALIYFLSNAHSFVAVLLGILKALVWPGMMVYYLFKFLGL